jgi:hypothetical protein
LENHGRSGRLSRLRRTLFVDHALGRGEVHLDVGKLGELGV